MAAVTITIDGLEAVKKAIENLDVEKLVKNALIQALESKPLVPHKASGEFYRYCPPRMDASSLIEVISNYGFNNDTLEIEKYSDNPVHWKIKISIERIE